MFGEQTFAQLRTGFRQRDVPADIVVNCTVIEVLLYVHRNRRFIMDGSPGRPPRLSHSG